MGLFELNLNRNLTKTDTSETNSDTSSMSSNQHNADVESKNNAHGGPGGQIDAKNILTGTVIVACIIKTSDTDSRVELSGNDARFYDNSKGGGGAITGDTATASFIRADKLPGTFVFQKRHGKDHDEDNVFEMYYTEAAANNHKNYLFIGRSGSPSIDLFYTDETVLTGIMGVRAEIPSVWDYSIRPTIYTQDLSKGTTPGLIGVQTWIAGEGTNGNATLAQLAEQLIFSDAPAFAVGDTITGNGTGAEGKIFKKYDDNTYVVEHLNNKTFNPAVDDACTSSGIGGPGNLVTAQYGAWGVLYVDNTYKARLGADFIPDADVAYDIGSTTAKIKDFYLDSTGLVKANGTAGAIFPTGWTVATTGAGVYVITHNFGTTNYVPIVTANSGLPTMIGVVTIQANDFTVVTYDSTGNLVDTAFYFSVTRK